MPMMTSVDIIQRPPEGDDVSTSPVAPVLDALVADGSLDRQRPNPVVVVQARDDLMRVPAATLDPKQNLDSATKMHGLLSHSLDVRPQRKSIAPPAADPAPSFNFPDLSP